LHHVPPVTGTVVIKYPRAANVLLFKDNVNQLNFGVKAVAAMVCPKLQKTARFCRNKNVKSGYCKMMHVMIDNPNE
jgi:hypothetical protein